MSFPEFGYIFFFFFSVASFLVFRLFMSSSVFGYKVFSFSLFPFVYVTFTKLLQVLLHHFAHFLYVGYGFRLQERH